MSHKMICKLVFIKGKSLWAMLPPSNDRFRRGRPAAFRPDNPKQDFSFETFRLSS